MAAGRIQHILLYQVLHHVQNLSTEVDRKKENYVTKVSNYKKGQVMMEKAAYIVSFEPFKETPICL